jgi:plasmid stabilization system protein ParE
MGSQFRIFLRPKAKVDLQEIASYLVENAGSGIAYEFVDAFEAHLSTLSEFPYLGQEHHFRKKGQKPIRIIPVSNFEKWLIMYRVFKQEEHIIISRVLHGSTNYKANMNIL